MRRPALAVVVVLVLAASAQADDVVVPVTVRPGQLVLAPATVVAGSSQVAVTVVDARGHGAGWKLLARATAPSGRPVVVAGVQMRCGPRSTCTLPRSAVRYPVALGRFRPTLLLDALRGTGMGTIVVTVKLAAGGPGAGFSFSVRPS